MLKLLYNKVTGLQLFNFIKKRLQHRCFLVNIAKFLRTPIEEHLQTAASVLLIIKLVGSIGYIYLLYQKDVAWFLLRQFVDVVITYSLLINSRNHSNTFLLLDLQKNRRYCSKGYLFWYYIYTWYILWLILIVYDIMINVYFNDIQLKTDGKTASEICTVSFQYLWIFFVFLDLWQPGPIKSVLLVIIGWLVGNTVFSTRTHNQFAFDCMFLSCHAHVSEWIHTLSDTDIQATREHHILKFR